MGPLQMTPPNGRSMRILHGALTAGLALAGAALVFLRRTQSLPTMVPPVTGIALAIAAISTLAVALAVVRPRFPTQRPDQTADAYWGDTTVRGTAIVMWAGVEGAGLLAAVGYLLTGASAALIALMLAILTLASLGPRRFEQDQAE